MAFEAEKYHQCSFCHRLTEMEDGTAILYKWEGVLAPFTHLHVVCEHCGSVGALFNPKKPEALLEAAEYLGIPIERPEQVDKATRRAFESLYGKKKADKPREIEPPKEPVDPIEQRYGHLLAFWRYLLETRDIHRELGIPELGD